MSEHVFIAAAARTPIGSFQGVLAKRTAPELGAHAIRAVLGTSDPARAIDEVIFGNVISAGLKQAPARQASRLAGLPDACGATTVNKVCGSGMKAAMLAFDLIRAGSAQAVVCGGMESMSNAPYLLTRLQSGLRMGHGESSGVAPVRDAMFLDGLEDAETGGSMGSFAQATADERQISREAMDAYALESVLRARRAIEQRRLAAEISPIQIDGNVISDDEQPRRAKPEKIPALKPAFKNDGTITAANSSSISDGAAALLISAESALADRTPLARIVGHATHSQHPATFTNAPVGAMRRLAARIGWRLDEVDLFEINEAFAMVTMIAMQELNLPHAKVNIYGGACAQGHPIGSTGARLLVTLAHALQNTGGRRGIASLCIGGGEATAVALERV
ncbi:MAG: acetyl-CoA C-acyltransferase [Gammaproteobacteria bacterium]|nr:acetyl-CoA C-acyltransferase [Gammaproteobacteria bacterium]